MTVFVVILPIVSSHFSFLIEKVTFFTLHYSAFVDKTVASLMEMIGLSQFLYQAVISVLLDRFVSDEYTFSPIYADVRFHLLMAFHEKNIIDICNVDPFYHFAWCLSACFKSMEIDSVYDFLLLLFLYT